MSDADALFARFVTACFWRNFCVSTIARASQVEMEAFLASAGFSPREQIVLLQELGRRLAHGERVLQAMGTPHGHA